MTDPLPQLTPRWLTGLTLVAVANLARVLIFGADPLYLFLGFGFFAVCCALHLCATPRLLHPWAVVTVVTTLALLAVGQIVTSTGSGMADRVWPTEPWYIFSVAGESDKQRFHQEFAFFIEHTHRIVAWTVGGMVIVLALGVLWTEPRRGAKWLTLAGLVILVGGYGQFHRGFIAQSGRPLNEVVLPGGPTAVTLAGVAILVRVAAAGALGRVRGGGTRLVATLALVAVMIQGLLGGFRVQKDALYGPELAAFHGVFAQVVLGLLVTIAVWTGRSAASAGADADARRVHRGAQVLAHLIFVQVVFGALIRHFPGPLSQRLHLLTAFLATAVAAWVLRAILVDSAARGRAGALAWALAALVAFQIYLGVEAWLAKFGASALLTSAKVTTESVVIRTLHALVGSCVWAASLALSIRLRPVAAPAPTLEPVESARAGALSPAASAV
jgi:hypothetical protein